MTLPQEIAGAKYEARVGVLKDYDNVWDAQVDVWHGRVDAASQKAIFAAAQRPHTPLDFVYLTEKTTAEQLNAYELLFYPHMTIVTEKQAELLKEYVAAGGTLVIGCRSGYKDATGQCVMENLPGLLSRLTGTDIPEYSFIAPDAGRVTIDWDGTELEASIFADLLEPLPGAHLEGTYTADYYAGAGALVSNTYGKGRAYYYGSAFCESTARIFLEKLGACAPYRDVISLPESCELAVRSKGENRYLFVLNYEKTPAQITLHKEALDLYTRKPVTGNITLEGYGTLVLKL